MNDMIIPEVKEKMDNAIEAASECEEKLINVTIRKDSKQHRQLLIIENTYLDKNIDTEKIYVCEDPEHYADDKHDAPYTYMGDRLMSEGYLKEVTPFAKNPLLGYATAIGAGSTTHYSDYYYVHNTGTVLYCGGSWRFGDNDGLWLWDGDYSSSSAYGSIGGRLCYKPL